MKKILFLTDMYLPKANANGLCVEELANVLKKRGYEIHVLCYKYTKEKEYEIINEVHIHRVRPNLFFLFRRYYESNYDRFLGRLSWIIGLGIFRIQKLLNIRNYPLESWVSCRRYWNYTNKIISSNSFCSVIGLYKPLTSAIALQKIKCEAIKILYIVDSFCDGKDKNNSFLNKHNWKWEQTLYHDVDYIINMRCHEKQLSESRYDVYREKMIFSDIPVLKPILSTSDTSAIQNILEIINEKINVFYCGTIYSPSVFEYFIKLVDDCVINEKQICLHVFSRNPNVKILDLCSKYSKLKFHGSIDENEKLFWLQNADAIFSECPSGDTMIPSKLFSSLSSGNKIIHVTNSDNDSCIPYLSKYKKSIIIDARKDFTSQKEKLVKFLSERSDLIDFNEIKKLFAENTPEFTANMIESLIYKEK